MLILMWAFLEFPTENFDNLIVATSLGENYNLYLF